MAMHRRERAAYPPEWEALARRAKDAAGWRCQLCGAVHGQPHPRTQSKVVLAVIHLNHRTMDCRPENLRVACQRCHNRYDTAHREHNRKVTCTRQWLAAARRRGQIPLMEVPEP